jgi:energy-coupling factor transport system ATP-binding protein
LSFYYKDQTDKPALGDIDLDVAEGEFLVILGPSGAGKSTLVHCLNGIIPRMVRGRRSGSVKTAGKGIGGPDAPIAVMARDIGIVFQDFENQLFSTNVKLEIAFSPENFGFSRDEISNIIDETLEVVGLTGYGEREPATLSGGEKQRLAIGSVLAGKPRIICMDEPTTDLDPIGKLEVFKIADSLRKQGKITLIIVEHETEEALYADRVMVMREGRILRIGAPAEILTEISMFDESGILPLQVPKAFVNLGHPETKELPLTPDKGIELYRSRGYSISRDKYGRLLAADAERAKRYGDVLIKVENLTHTYENGTTAIKNVSIEVREGEFLAVLGHNGSGKTTLVKHFNGLLQPTSGSVTVCGKDTRKESIFKIGRDVGFAFQNPDHQIFSMTVRDEVCFSPKLRGVSAEEIESGMREALDAVDLTGYEEQDPFTLSKGERQRVAVASILSAKPRVIILDEPTTGLDYKEQRKMMDLIKRLNENGHTVIIVTHTMWVVAEYAHRAAVVNNGEIVLYGTAREVFSNDDLLRGYSLRTPHIVGMSNMLGCTLLSVDEFVSCTEKKG